MCPGHWLPLLNHLEVIILMSQQHLAIILLRLQGVVGKHVSDDWLPCDPSLVH